MKGCRPLGIEEIGEVVKNFGGKYVKRDRALFLLGVKSGFRISELLSLRIADVISSGKMLDRVTVARKNMKKQVEGRTVLLHPDARASLREWVGQLDSWGVPDDHFLFLSRKGENRPMSRVHAWRILHGAFEAGGLKGKLGTHSMRKTFANRIYEALNFDLVRTQKALGHRNINSTVSYLSFREEDIDSAILAI